MVDEAIVASRAPQAPPDCVLLFTGHMVDAPDRGPAKSRFPRTPEAEAIARGLIEEAVTKELHAGENMFGIAGGACGSDILFHEVCASLGVPTRLFLALPVRPFQVASVQRGGPDWVDRYQKLCERLPPQVLQDTEALPDWLADRRDYDLWQRNNQWMMFHAVATNARRLTLLSLYNADRDADGPGGTAHLIGLARRWGFKSVELDGRKLLAGVTTPPRLSAGYAPADAGANGPKCAFTFTCRAAAVPMSSNSWMCAASALSMAFAAAGSIWPNPSSFRPVALRSTL